MHPVGGHNTGCGGRRPLGSGDRRHGRGGPGYGLVDINVFRPREDFEQTSSGKRPFIRPNMGLPVRQPLQAHGLFGLKRPLTGQPRPELLQPGVDGRPDASSRLSTNLPKNKSTGASS